MSLMSTTIAMTTTMLEASVSGAPYRLEYVWGRLKVVIVVRGPAPRPQLMACASPPVAPPFVPGVLAAP
jgi:hypothetical protein